MKRGWKSVHCFGSICIAVDFGNNAYEVQHVGIGHYKLHRWPDPPREPQRSRKTNVRRR